MNPVVEVAGVNTRYPDLPLGALGIVYEIGQNRKVRVIFPKLTSQGLVRYIYSWHQLDDVHVLTQSKTNTHQQVNVQTAKDLAFLIKEHVQFVEPEILNLSDQRRKIHQLLDLVTTSELYQSQQDIYQQGLVQVESLLQKAEELEKVYIRYIREILIGQKIVSYSKKLSSDDSIASDYQYHKVKQEYQYMKDSAHAYGELLRTSQV